MESITSSLVVASDSVDEGPSQEVEEQEQENSVQGRGLNQDQHHRRTLHHLVYYRPHVSLFQVSSFNMRDEACAAFVVLVAFWIFACMTVILGFYGSSTIQLEPNSSLLVKANSFFVQSIQLKETRETLPGPMLYGFNKAPPLDVQTTWSEKHDAVVESGDHKAWQYFLNPGSKIDVSYSVKSPTFTALSLVIAQGGSLTEWIEDPLYPNTTLSWNIIHGNGTIELEILNANIYHIALGNFNLERVQVQLNFTIEALMYNTTQAYCECSLSHHHLCTMGLHPFVPNVAVLTTPGPVLGVTNHKWYVKLSYCQRWISYFMTSVSVTVFILLIIKILSTYRTISGYGAVLQARRTETESTPLLSAKDDDLSSLGSSYNSMSEDEEGLNDAVAIMNGKQLVGESNNDHLCVCILCLDALRDCFFLPCGHCASCFPCGTRVIEEAGVCPICRKATRKVRRIFSV